MSLPEALPDAALPAMSPGFLVDKDAEAGGDDGLDSHNPGDLVEGTVDFGVKPWAPPCLMVRLDSGGMARVCVTELAEEEAWRDNPLSRYRNSRASGMFCRRRGGGVFW